MGIRFRCHACTKKLHVKSFLAGKRGVCPNCGASVEIPSHSELPAGAADKSARKQRQPQNGRHSSAVVVSASAASREAPSGKGPSGKGPSGKGDVPRAVAVSQTDAIAEAPDAVWYVRPPSGGQYGPANGEIMRRWMLEGRVSNDSLVWREGWPDWKAATDVFPELMSTRTQVSIPEPERREPPTTLAVEQPTNILRQRPRRKRSKSAALGLVVILILLTVSLIVALIYILNRQA